MGTDCHIVVTGPNAQRLAELGADRADDLEKLWSRFLLDSEISQINTADGRETLVSQPTFDLVEKAVLAWRLSGGRFDPTMHRQINQLGYDRTFSAIGSDAGLDARRGQPSYGCEQIVLDSVRLAVTIPAEIGLDPGGIGKGLAADMISQELVDAGARGVLVSLGGDLRVRGAAPTSDGWVVRVRDPRSPQHSLATVTLDDAALATSTTLERTWRTACGMQHHLLDPATGLPWNGKAISATAIAGEAWWAEAATKAAILTPDCSDLPDPRTHIPNVAVLKLMGDDSKQRFGSFESYEL